jgi:hypothetical protein
MNARLPAEPILWQSAANRCNRTYHSAALAANSWSSTVRIIGVPVGRSWPAGISNSLLRSSKSWLRPSGLFKSAFSSFSRFCRIAILEHLFQKLRAPRIERRQSRIQRSWFLGKNSLHWIIGKRCAQLSLNRSTTTAIVVLDRVSAKTKSISRGSQKNCVCKFLQVEAQFCRSPLASGKAIDTKTRTACRPAYDSPSKPETLCPICQKLRVLS